MTPRRASLLLSLHTHTHIRYDGVVSLECLKGWDGGFHFTFVGVDVCNTAEDRLIVQGDDARMTEKADHLRDLLDFKKTHTKN